MKKEIRAWLIVSALQVAWIGPCVYHATTTHEPVEEQMIESTEDIIRFRMEDVDVETEEVTVEPVEKDIVEDAELESLGTFFLTAYCPCNKCTDGDGLTSLNRPPVEGRTVAVDPSMIPYGTVLVINGHEYVAEDCGGKWIQGKHIDIFFDNHDEARKFGEQYAEVKIWP